MYDKDRFHDYILLEMQRAGKKTFSIPDEFWDEDFPDSLFTKLEDRGYVEKIDKELIINPVLEEDYPEIFLMLDIITKAAVQSSIDELVDQGVVESIYDPETNDFLYRFKEGYEDGFI